jgi:hypothetical protein
LQNDWVLLLQGAQYGGAWESGTGYQPLAYGNFDKIKAVHRSGYADCCTYCYWHYESENIWSRCGTYNFELKKNGAFVLESGAWWEQAPGCSVDHQSENIVCDIGLTLDSGDMLTPTWYEPSHGLYTEDNDGTITMDLYGLPVSGRF